MLLYFSCIQTSIIVPRVFCQSAPHLPSCCHRHGSCSLHTERQAELAFHPNCVAFGSYYLRGFLPRSSVGCDWRAHDGALMYDRRYEGKGGVLTSLIVLCHRERDIHHGWCPIRLLLDAGMRGTPVELLSQKGTGCIGDYVYMNSG